MAFDVAPYEDMVRLTVTHGELEAGSATAQGIQQGWPVVLSSLKSLLETGQGVPAPVLGLIAFMAVEKLPSAEALLRATQHNGAGVG